MNLFFWKKKPETKTEKAKRLMKEGAAKAAPVLGTVFDALWCVLKLLPSAVVGVWGLFKKILPGLCEVLNSAAPVIKKLLVGVFLLLDWVCSALLGKASTLKKERDAKKAREAAEAAALAQAPETAPTEEAVVEAAAAEPVAVVETAQEELADGARAEREAGVAELETGGADPESVETAPESTPESTPESATAKPVESK